MARFVTGPNFNCRFRDLTAKISCSLFHLCPKTSTTVSSGLKSTAGWFEFHTLVSNFPRASSAFTSSLALRAASAVPVEWPLSSMYMSLSTMLLPMGSDWREISANILTELVAMSGAGHHTAGEAIGMRLATSSHLQSAPQSDGRFGRM